MYAVRQCFFLLCETTETERKKNNKLQNLTECEFMVSDTKMQEIKWVTIIIKYNNEIKYRNGTIE